MKLLVLILNKIELLDDLLETFAAAKIGGATILQSRGMVRELYQAGREDDMFLGSLRALLDADREENRTILTVVKDDKVKETIGIIESVVGDLNKPDTGIVFTMPVDDVKGINGE